MRPMRYAERQAREHRPFSPITCRLFNRLQSILLSEMAGVIFLLAETIIMIMEETLKGNNQNVP